MVLRRLWGALRRFLTEAPGPLWRWCLLAWPLSLIPGVALGYWGLWLYRTLTGQEAEPVDAGNGSPWFVVLIGPAIEAGLLLGLLYILRTLGASGRTAVTASALLWGALHGLINPVWFWAPAWLFFVTSAGAWAWRRHGKWHAFAAAFVPHALQNAAVLASIALFPS